MRNPVLQIDDISVSYGPRAALSALSFDVQAGEIVGLLGPNGAGKTTLIKTICAKLIPDSGSISICGHTVKRGAENRKSVGLVPQDIGLYMHLTARENLGVFGRMFGLKGNALKQAVDDALETVNLTSRAHDAVSGLSGGMKRRINYAAAILHRPALLILDEPTAGVDIPARDGIHEVTRNLAAQGFGVLLVTHELESAQALCDRVLILKDGKKLAFDTPASVLYDIYKGARECEIYVETSADSAKLNALNFSQTEEPLIWKSTLAPDTKMPLATISQSLEKAGISVREITVRTPGLPELFHDIQSGAVS